MAVASRQGGGLNVSVIGRMYQTSLTDQYSSNVQNAAQVITISSSINPETYVIFCRLFYKKILFLFMSMNCLILRRLTPLM